MRVQLTLTIPNRYQKDVNSCTYNLAYTHLLRSVRQAMPTLLLVFLTSWYLCPCVTPSLDCGLHLVTCSS